MKQKRWVLLDVLLKCKVCRRQHVQLEQGHDKLLRMKREMTLGLSSICQN